MTIAGFQVLPGGLATCGFEESSMSPSRLAPQRPSVIAGLRARAGRVSLHGELAPSSAAVKRWIAPLLPFDVCTPVARITWTASDTIPVQLRAAWFDDGMASRPDATHSRLGYEFVIPCLHGP